MRVIDFFSGCGGTSWGFKEAGFNILLGIDWDKDAIQTFSQNLSPAQTLCADISEIPVETLSEYLGTDSQPVLFTGCAPCQPFSTQNRLKKDNDARKSLLLEFLRFVVHYLPEYVFVENVPGIQKVDRDKGLVAEFTNTLKENGYHVDSGNVLAWDFGVPQKRERFVLIASRLGSVQLPKHIHEINPKAKQTITVRDWISDLPPIAAGETHASDRDHQAAALQEITLKRLAFTPEGGSRLNWPKELWLDCHKQHNGHTDVYGRLAWDKPANSLTTKCTSISNGRFGHPTQDRALSAREAACLQTFPKSFKFHGTLASKARQIGNAVPPLMAQCFGEYFKSHYAKASNKKRHTVLSNRKAAMRN